jgi:hypothetical protein
MPLLTIQYVYFGASGAHTRQPRAVSSYGGFTPIPGLNPGGTSTLMSGTPYVPEYPPDLSSLSLAYAFTNVSGCIEGPRTSYVATMLPPSGTVGSNPIVTNYVYVPVGGPGNGGSGAVIDAFDATINSLVDNNFVTVSPDPGGTLTTEANAEGWVDTSSSGYTIVADHPNIGSYSTWSTLPLFDRWVDLTDPSPPSSLVSGANLTPAQDETVYALAFYHDPVKTKEHYDKRPVEKSLSEYVAKNIAEIFKGPKETVENPGYGNIGDPAEMVGELRALNARIAGLEVRLDAFGSAFIKAEDRPKTGRQGR